MPADRDPVPPPSRDYDRPRLVEGLDYYIEAGRWVFTARFHLARGSCCGSGCRHCPYGDGNPATEPGEK